MTFDAHRATIRSFGVLVGRALLGLLFLFSGAGMLMGGIGNTAGYFESVGLPMASLLAVLVIAVKIIAGGSLILGFKTDLAASALIVFTLLATFIAHMDVQDINLFKNLSIVGGLIYVIAYGAGDGWKLGAKKATAEVPPIQTM